MKCKNCGKANSFPFCCVECSNRWEEKEAIKDSYEDVKVHPQTGTVEPCDVDLFDMFNDR